MSSYEGELHRIVEEVVGRVEWQTTTLGYCECPGASQHTSGSSPRDCAVFLDGCPALKCFHEHCQAAVIEAAHAIRELADSLPGAPERPRLSPVERREEAFRKRLRRLTVDAQYFLLPKLKREPVPIEEWTKASPYPLAGTRIEDHWRLFLDGLFKSEDAIWIGERWQSG